MLVVPIAKLNGSDFYEYHRTYQGASIEGT